MIRGILALILIASPFTASAQALPSAGAAVDPLTVSLSPRYPRPFESVRISPQSTLVDLSASTVVVTASGKEVGRGTGRESYLIPTAGIGTSVPVRVTVTAPDGVYTEDLTIRPTDIALSVDSLSTSHPFYEGGALVAPEGRVRIVALADLRSSPGARIASSELIYTWKTGGRILTAESGLGKSVLTATAPVLFRDAPISVTVSNRDGSIVGEAATVIKPSEPKLVLYADSPLLGPQFSRALSGTFTLTDEEGAFRAVPYFFSAKPYLEWTLGGASAGTEDSVTVRTTGDAAGVASLQAEASQPNSYYRATESLRVRYGTETPSFFGL